MLTGTVSFNVAPLSDTDVWFANAAAWSNYWATQDVGTITFNPITTTTYAALALVDIGSAAFDVDGTLYYLVQQATFDSLVARVAALNAAFELMRTQLKAAGLITNAQ